MYKATRKFVLRNLSHPKTPTVLMLYSSYSIRYSFQLWFYNKAPLSYHMKILNKMQRRAAIWILGASNTSPSEGIEAIVGIIPIKFHLQKLTERSLICPFKLPANHIIRDLMDDSPHQSKEPNPHTVSSLTN